VVVGNDIIVFRLVNHLYLNVDEQRNSTHQTLYYYKPEWLFLSSIDYNAFQDF
jgi:hypothetical protein